MSRQTRAGRAGEEARANALAAQLQSAGFSVAATLAEREVFLRAQQLDLKRSARELLSLQTQSLQSLRDALHHQEAR